MNDPGFSEAVLMALAAALLGFGVLTTLSVPLWPVAAGLWMLAAG